MYCKSCNYEIDDNSKFCPNCGHQIQKLEAPQETTQNEITPNYEIKKCEICGYSWLTGEIICPNCKNNTQVKETFSVHNLMDKLEKIDNENLAVTFADKMYQTLRGKKISKKDEIKVNLIKFYPLPKTKNALYDFVVFSDANSKITPTGNAKDIQSQRIVADAWKAKLEQSYHLAKLKYGHEADFIEIKNLYEERKRKERLEIILPLAIGFGIFIILFGFLMIMYLLETVLG